MTCPDCGAAARDGSCATCGWRTVARANLDTMRRMIRDSATVRATVTPACERSSRGRINRQPGP